MIELVDVYKRFGAQMVLRGVNWQIGAGEQWLLSGASGIGKTTLLRIVTGLEKPDSGAVLCEEDIRFAMVFQEDRLLEARSALENVLLVCQGRQDAPRARALLAELLPEGTPEDRAVAQLSGGMRRRVALARALAAQSDVLVLDEPFTGLDEQTRARAASCIERHRDGRALLLAAHGFAPAPEMKTLRLGG